MPLLIISDIHSNLEALQAVLADAKGRYDRVYCMGDLVGYGADPNAVTDWARAEVAQIVRGNHDRACTGLDSLDLFNPAAKESALWTQRQLTRENHRYLERLARGPVRVAWEMPGFDIGFDMVHGSPVDEDEYLINLTDAQPLVEDLEVTLTLFGHTHVQGGFLLGPAGVKRIDPQQPLELEQRYYYLVNPGSVGQPRDRDPRAAYAFFWPEEHRMEYHRVEYNIDAAARKIRDAGLPEVLAARLYEGR